METWDCVVVGGGVAGLAAATWIARYRRSVLVVDEGRPRNRWTREGHGYLGLDPFDPDDLLCRGRERLTQYPTTEVRAGRVSSVDGRKDEFTVQAGGEIGARRIVLASGAEDVFPEVPGFEEHFGVDAFHCPGCDGYEVRGRDVVVVGWDPAVIELARALVEWAASVTVVTPQPVVEEESGEMSELRMAGVRIVSGDIAQLHGPRSKLDCVELAGGDRIGCDAAFFALDCRARGELAARLGCALDDDGFVCVDEKGETTVPGVYAAGDLTPGLQLVQVAAAEGTTAGVHCAKSLS